MLSAFPLSMLMVLLAIVAFQSSPRFHSNFRCYPVSGFEIALSRCKTLSMLVVHFVDHCSFPPAFHRTLQANPNRIRIPLTKPLSMLVVHVDHRSFPLLPNHCFHLHASTIPCSIAMPSYGHNCYSIPSSMLPASPSASYFLFSSFSTPITLASLHPPYLYSDFAFIYLPASTCPVTLYCFQVSISFLLLLTLVHVVFLILNPK